MTVGELVRAAHVLHVAALTDDMLRRPYDATVDAFNPTVTKPAPLWGGQHINDASQDPDDPWWIYS